MKQNNNFQKSNNDVAQDFNGAIINTQINNLKLDDELSLFKKEYNERSKDSQEYEVKIYFDGMVILEKELYEQIEEIIYSPYKYRLKFNYTNCENRTTIKIYKKIETYVYKLLKRYLDRDIQKISYHKYHMFVNTLVRESIQEELVDNEQRIAESVYYVEDKMIPLLEIFFNKEVLPFNEYSDEAFFTSLTENNIEYITKEFQPKTIEEFFEKNPHCLDYGNYMELDLLYETLNDYDYRVFGEFIKRWHPFDIDLGGLKEFLAWSNYNSIMYKEVDGMNPWCLYNMCELKSWNDDNSRFWTDFFSQEDIEKEKDSIEEQFEKHMQQFRD